MRSESTAYGEALKATGVTVETRNFDGVTREFFGMGAVVPQAVGTMGFANANLRAAFANQRLA